MLTASSSGDCQAPALYDAFTTLSRCAAAVASDGTAFTCPPNAVSTMPAAGLAYSGSAR